MTNVVASVRATGNTPAADLATGGAGEEEEMESGTRSAEASRKRGRTVALRVVTGCVVSLAMLSSAGVRHEVRAAQSTPRVLAPSVAMPVYFEKNMGQAASQISYIVHAGSDILYLTGRGEIVAPVARSVAWMAPVRGAIHPRVVGEEKLPGVINYLLGNDRRQWRTNIPTYGEVVYHDVYPGIDLSFHGRGGKLEYDWVVRPGADPSRIKLRVTGAGRAMLDSRGTVRFGEAPIVQTKPTLYQRSPGIEHVVRGEYQLAGGDILGFRIGRYDREHALIIDPVILFAKLIGGAGDDMPEGIQVDARGNIYVAGDTNSDHFPLKNAYQGSRHGDKDLFVVKLSPSGSLIYGTYVGGAGRERSNGIAVDRAGRAYVAGSTLSGNFPGSAYGGPGAVAVSLNPGGNSLHYSIVTNADSANAVAVDGHGGAYFAIRNKTDALVMKVTPDVHTSLSDPLASSYPTGMAVTRNGIVVMVGNTNAPGLQTVRAVQSSYGGGTADAFVLGLSTQLSQVVFFTYLGGKSFDSADAVTVGGSNNILVAGETASTDFPDKNTVDLIQDTSPFVAKFSSDGSKLLYNTVIGSSVLTEPGAIAVNKRGTVAIGGLVRGTGLVPNNSLRGQDAYGGGVEDGFLSALDASGDQVTFNTYLGGNGDDVVTGVAFGGSGNLFVAGLTSSSNFPRTRGQRFNTSGNFDGFVVKVGKLR